MLFPTVAHVSEDQLDRGLTNLVKDGAYAQASGALTGGVLLVGYGLALGASNFVIGLLAAVPFLAQLAQVPTILLVERLRARRLIALGSLSLARLLLIPIAFLPFLDSPPLAQTLLIVGVGAGALLNSMSACAWNSWIHDLVPERILGGFFARRMFYATGFTVVIGIGACVFIDWWGESQAAGPAYAYTALFLVGAAAGAVSTLYLSRVPEPTMVPPERKIHLGRMLAEPFRDQNFRRLIWFLAS
jgi:MFS family permease